MTPNITRLDAIGKNNEIVNRKDYKGGIKCVILDWSGTTADAHVLAPAVAFCEVFEKHGVPITMEESRGPMGLRKDLHIAKILEIPAVKERWTKKKGEKPTQATVDLLFKDFVPMQLRVLEKHTTLLPGVAETTQKFQKQNIKLGSTTGFTKSMVDILLRDARKQGYVPDSSVAGDQVINNLGFRPAPFMVYQNLLNLGIWPIESVIKVDDTVSGVGEGLNAGCWSVGIYGYSNYTNVNSLKEWDEMPAKIKNERLLKSKQKLLSSNAHYVIKEFGDLEHVLEDINQRIANGETPFTINTLYK